MREATGTLLPMVGTLTANGAILSALCLLFLLSIPAVSIVRRRRLVRSSAQLMSSMRGKNWPTIRALVDVVTVVPQTEPIRGSATEVVGYLATLTYFYRNPDLQSGDYSRMFDKKKDAEVWAASWKARSVMIHVDPRDPSRSVLRREDL